MSIKLKGSSDGSVSLDAPADTSPTGTDITFVLPTADGTAEQVLKTDGSGNLSFADNVSSGRNIVINGAMNVAQRGTSKTGITAAGYPTVDRMIWALFNCGTWTSTQESDGPPGFSNSFKALCTTADASPAASDYAVFQYFFEAQDLQHLKYGTSDAVPITVSFWVKSNKTGNASLGALQFDGSQRTFSKQYTINSANTWEYKTITIPADASGQIDDDNGAGMLIEWWCNSGSDFQGGSHPATWTAKDDTDRNASPIGIGQAVNDYFQITGIQVEVGSVATKFEHRIYVDELARCHRYYWQQNASTAYTRYGIVSVEHGGAAETVIHLPTTMREPPALLHGTVGNSTIYSGNTLFTATALAMDNTSANAVCIAIGSSGLTAGRAGTFLSNNTTDFYLGFDAEL